MPHAESDDNCWRRGNIQPMQPGSTRPDLVEQGFVGGQRGAWLLGW
jgi:hypothetical protein